MLPYVDGYFPSTVNISSVYPCLLLDYPHSVLIHLSSVKTIKINKSVFNYNTFKSNVAISLNRYYCCRFHDCVWLITINKTGRHCNIMHHEAMLLKLGTVLRDALALDLCAWCRTSAWNVPGWWHAQRRRLFWTAERCSKWAEMSWCSRSNGCFLRQC